MRLPSALSRVMGSASGDLLYNPNSAAILRVELTGLGARPFIGFGAY
ncbi:hypothetical protein GFS31_36870 [Leptolyngbya sp. BL0902]|nr:hypothetical protein GFS31_36870 [Leptolyngbya sp. BL0902]